MEISKRIRKLSLFSLVFGFLLSTACGAETVTLATWNIRIYSTGSRDNRELAEICSILSKYDFIAIQELRDTDVLDRTVDMLSVQYGRSYEYVVSGPAGRGTKERFAFLYDAGKLFWKDVSFTFRDDDDRLSREPFAALFQAGEFDFYIITVHSIWGDSVRERRAEAAILDDIYLIVQNLDDEQDVLLVGDFNLPPDDEGFDDFSSVGGLFPVNPNRPTTIHDSLYDNIWMQRQHTGEFTGEWGVFSFDELLYGDDDRAASLAVSDHRPLWARFDTAGPDDD